ncbi:hypothetical protein ACFTSD_14380 [Nocardiaceae bacterium NPDC056970]
MRGKMMEERRKFAEDRGWMVGDGYPDNDGSAVRPRMRPEYERTFADL